jgi:UDPglucose 6-dehydrogenase
MCASAEEAVAGADAAVLVTEWASIVGLAWEELRPTMRTPLVIDGRNALDLGAMTAAGYVSEGIGRIPS